MPGLLNRKPYVVQSIMWVIILASYLFASTLSFVTSKFVLSYLPFNFVDTAIPGVSEALANSKHYDLVEFGLSVFFFVCFLSFTYILTRKRENVNKVAITGYEYLYLATSFILYIQSHFVSYSGKSVVILVAIIQFLYLLIKQLRAKITLKITPVQFINGLLAGFAIFLLVKLYTTSLALPLLIAVAVVFLYLTASYKRLVSHPAHLILIFSVFFPTDINILLITIVVTFLALWTRPSKSLREMAQNILYPVATIFLITYQPLYYAGNLDSVEEGIWLGWLQSMRSGKEMYRDFVAYQPPLLAWGLNAFVSLTSESIRSVRLYFHLLEILGYILIYFSVRKLLTTKIALGTTMLTLFALTATNVRNNVEIRVSLALFALSVFYSYTKNKSRNTLFTAGIVSTLSFLVSFEVGVAAIVTIFICLLLFESKRLKAIIIYVAGLSAGIIPPVFYLLLQGSLKAFVSQITFYGSAFSKGYFNIAMAEPIQTSFFRWHLVWQYLANDPFYYAFTRFILLGTLALLVIPILKKKGFFVWPDWKSMKPSQIYSFSISIFGLFLMRSVLGRSDYHHLLFVMIISIPLLLWLLEHYTKHSKYITHLVCVLLLLVFTGKRLQEVFLTERLFTLTTYGEIVENYKSYTSSRSEILMGVEVNTEELNDVLTEIDTRTTADESIFVFPWNPELYFLTNRKNATSYDIPYAFWTEEDQLKMIAELKNSKPEFVVYNPGKGFGGMSIDTLPLVNEHILANYTQEKQLYSFRLLTKNE